MIVAEKLGMTLQQLREQMTYEELLIWNTFYGLRRDEEEAAHRRAEQKANARRR